MSKVRIRKREGRWVVQRPGYGFTAVEELRCVSFDEAVTRAGGGRMPGSSGGVFERDDRQMIHRQLYIGHAGRELS